MKKFSSVEQMVDELSGDDIEFVNDVKEQIRSKRLVTQLVVLRNLAGMTQGQVAEKMGVKQGTVSKLERSPDDSVTIGELRRYLQAVQASMNIELQRGRPTLVSMVKYHALKMNELLQQIADIPQGDRDLERGVSAFLTEALMNLLSFVDQAHSTVASACGCNRTINVSVEIIDEKIAEVQKLSAKTSTSERDTVTA